MICKFIKKKKKKELPVNVVSGIRVALVVGHCEKSQGASTVDHKSEFMLWSEFAIGMSMRYKSVDLVEYKVFYRKKPGSRGIEQAYNDVEAWGADALVELHFNAFNGTVRGCETLCSYDANDLAFANVVHRHSLISLKCVDREVKRKTRSDRGGRSTSGFKGPNCLVEPFFGDSHDDYENFVILKDAYMGGLHDSILEFFNVLEV